MFVDASDGSFMNYAHLISTPLGRSKSTCTVDFWYYLYQSETDQFDAKLTLLLTGSEGTLVRI